MNLQIFNLDKHFSFIKVGKLRRKAHLLNFLSSILYLPIRLSVLVVIWTSTYKILGVEKIGKYSLYGMIKYYFLFIVIEYISGYFRGLPYNVWSEIITGDISKFICRPVNYIKYKFYYGFGFVFNIFMLSVILLYVIWVSANGLYNIHIFLISLISIFLGIIILFYVYISIGFLSFWTESIFGYRDLILHIGAFLGGAIIPLSLMPKSFYYLTLLFPFRYTIYEPVKIFLSIINFENSIRILLVQIMYILLLNIFTSCIYKLGIKRYESNGG